MPLPLTQSTARACRLATVEVEARTRELQCVGRAFQIGLLVKQSAHHTTCLLKKQKPQSVWRGSDMPPEARVLCGDVSRTTITSGLLLRPLCDQPESEPPSLVPQAFHAFAVAMNTHMYTTSFELSWCERSCHVGAGGCGTLCHFSTVRC